MGAMLVSTIVVGAAFFFYKYVVSNHENLQTENQLKFKIELIHERLNRLVLEAEEITKDNELLVFEMNNKTAELEVNEGFLCIHDLNSDTLFWQLTDQQYFNVKNTLKIKGISLGFEYNGLPFEWYFYKKYGKQHLVEISGR